MKSDDFVTGMNPARSEEALAIALLAASAGRPVQSEQSAFRRLCTDRARKRAARDLRLAVKA